MSYREIISQSEEYILISTNPPSFPLRCLNITTQLPSVKVLFSPSCLSLLLTSPGHPIKGVTLVKKREEKRPCSFCKNRAISENGLFKATKETRDEALRIFYSKNQFMLLDEYGRENLKRETLERRVALTPSVHLERINRFTIDLYVLMLHHYEDPDYINFPNRWKEVLDEILSFVKGTFLNEKLHVKLIYPWNKVLGPRKG